MALAVPALSLPLSGIHVAQAWTVHAVQRLLGVPETGCYDLTTREAVTAVQARAGLASTGVDASRTWSLYDRLSA